LLLDIKQVSPFDIWCHQSLYW